VKQDISPQNTNKSGKKGMFGYILLGIGISVIALAVAAYWFTTSVVTGVNETHQTKLIEIYTQQIQKNFNAAITREIDRVDDIVRRPDVVNGLASGDPSVIEGLEQRIQLETSGTISVHLIASGTAQVDNSISPPLNFASLDLVRRVEQGQTAPMEILMLNNSYYIQMAQPVRNGQIIGTLVLNLNIGFLDSVLALFDTDAGNLTLQQQFNAETSQDILQYGSKSANTPQIMATNNPNWKLSYQPSDLIVSSNILKPEQIMIPMVIAIIIVIVAMFVTGQMLQSTVKQDAGNFTRYTQKLLTGQPIDVPNFKLSLFLAMAKSLARVKIKTRQPKMKEVTNPFDSPVYPENSESVTQEQGNSTPQDDILNIDMIADDIDILGINKPQAQQVNKSLVQEKLFRAYDIRGVAGQSLDRSVARQIGLALGSEAFERGEQTILVARDGRLSSVELTKGLIAGLTESGRDVVDLGMVPISLLYFSFHELGIKSGVMVTASHQPSNINGFKITLAGQDLAGKEMLGLYHRINNENYLSGQGQYSKQDMAEKYQGRIFTDVQLSRKLKVVVDAGNGVAGTLVQDLLSKLGCHVVPLNCTVNGQFPSHLPDPGKEENLKELVASVKSNNAHLGLAFDGDGDRLGVVTNSGRIISPDILLMLLAKDVLSRNKGATVLYDVNCSRRLQGLIVGFGGKPLLWKTGRSNILRKMKESGALISGNLAGNLFFKERWYGFDDAIYGAARLLEVIAGQRQSADELFASFPDDVSTPEIYIPVTEGSKEATVSRLAKNAIFPGGTVHKVDGLRVDFSDGWGMARASQTSSRLALRFEADNQAALIRIQEGFKHELRTIDSSLEFPF